MSVVRQSVMQRSSRSAVVRAGSNMQYHGARSLAIFLAIVLVTTRLPASGFIIRKVDNWDVTANLDATTDLEAAESAVLEVWSDLKNQQEVKALNNSEPNADTVIALIKLKKETTQNTTNNSIISDVKSTTSISVTTNVINTENLNVDLGTSTALPEMVPDTTLATATLLVSTNIIETTSPAAINDNQDIKIEENDSRRIENIRSLKNPITTKPDSQNSEIYSKYITNGAQDIKDNDLLAITTAVVDDMNSEVANSTNLVPNNYDVSSSESVTDIIYPTESINNTLSFESVTDNTLPTETTIITTESTTSKIDTETSTDTDYRITTSQTFYQTELHINSEASSLVVTEDFTDNKMTVATERTDLENLDTTTFQTAETLSTDIATDLIISTTLPPWKNYKTINRRRTTTANTEETTISELEMTKAESGRIVVGNRLGNNQIATTALEEQTTGTFDILNGNETNLNGASELEMKTNISTTNAVDTDTDTTKSALYGQPENLGMHSPSLETTSTNLDTQTSKIDTQTEKNETKIANENTQALQLDVVSSKRAGYLDNTETTSLQPEHGTAVIVVRKEDSNFTDSFATMYGDAGYGELSELHVSKNKTEAESQRQMVEDAIKEELLMERIINQNEFLNAGHRAPEQLGDSTKVQDESTTPLSDDALGVKPIGLDNKKKSPLYTVSPNYKPLKKLDVQHSKQVVRDPDDNSWRNESISSLGIVFKPKNASKSFTEVLKNKTTELFAITKQGDKSDVPDLRVRLEKIAELRKSKKKRINNFGDSLYSDYEESSAENTASVMEEAPTTTMITPPSSTTKHDISINDIWSGKINIFNMEKDDTTTQKPKKNHNSDYYDTTDDYDADYATLPKIDLKKFTTNTSQNNNATHPPELYATRSKGFTPTTSTYAPDRQPTVQYFPPTKKVGQKVYYDYDTDFNKRLNLYTHKDTTKPTVSTTQIKFETSTTPLPYTQTHRNEDLEKALFLRSRLHSTEPQYEEHDKNFNRASYVIRHYKDFINDAAKVSDDDKISEYMPYTEAPIRGVTINEMGKYLSSKDRSPDIYEYDSQFRKDIMSRFVDNFNQNSERFKVDFPILFNNSVVHRKEDDNGRVVASSSAVMKRLYDTADPRSKFLITAKPCNGHCESIDVDLSPAYELHYYVPDQEEKEEMEPHLNTLPSLYKL